jgi:transforming growth factor-beta-induced protein
LVVALTQANLVATFQGGDSGPFTVFAPSNAAFVALLDDLGVDRISEIDNTTLTAVLTYHVVNGTVKSTDLTDGMLVKTLQGNTFTVNTSNGVSIDVNASDQKGISVTQADVEASNGVIHVIDAVLRPETPGTVPSGDIVETADENGLDSLAIALTEADLVATFQGDDSGPFTVFAPSNAAFVALLDDLGVATISEIDKTTLTAVLQAHVIDGVFQESQITNGREVSTLGEAPITFSTSSGVKVSSENTADATIVTTDVWATNGVVHVIDKVLRP